MLSGMMAQAGMGGLVVTEVRGQSFPAAEEGSGPVSKEVVCPSGTQLLGGYWDLDLVESYDSQQSSFPELTYSIFSTPDFTLNKFSVTVEVFPSSTFLNKVGVVPIAYCGQLTFPMQMGMIGGELLDINTVSLLVASIGVNPVITGLVGITIAGVAGQAIWFIHKRRTKNA